MTTEKCQSRHLAIRVRLGDGRRVAHPSRQRACAECYPFHVDVEHRRDVERKHLRYQQPADHGYAQGLAQFRSGPTPSAIGSTPNSAASVVIMMGRKRSSAAS